MRLWILTFVGIALIIAGIQGNPGSMIGAIIDPGDMVEGATNANTTTNSAKQAPILGSILGGVAAGG